MRFGLRRAFSCLLAIATIVACAGAFPTTAHATASKHLSSKKRVKMHAKKHAKKKAKGAKKRRKTRKQKRTRRRPIPTRKRNPRPRSLAPNVVRHAPPPTVATPNAYSGSPAETTPPAPPPGAIPLHDPSAPAEERRVHLDMTRPYGQATPTPKAEPERGLASVPAEPEPALVEPTPVPIPTP
ncbi:MAG: hypothetical protein JST04_07605 [Bdellovibrionales bacterium]|nr:hypothetical protein [Bdellovibrionales bacterium]